MKIASLIHDTPHSTASISRREETRAEESRQRQEAAQDTVTISDEARGRLEAKESGESSDKKKDPRKDDYQWLKEALAESNSIFDNESETARRAPTPKIDKLQQQLKQLQTEIAQATKELAEARSQTEAPTAQQAAIPGNAAPAGPGSGDVQAAQEKLTKLTQQLVQISQEMQMASQYGGTETSSELPVFTASASQEG